MAAGTLKRKTGERPQGTPCRCFFCAKLYAKTQPSKLVSCVFARKMNVCNVSHKQRKRGSHWKTQEIKEG